MVAAVTAYIALGSNLGCPKTQLLQALKALTVAPNVQVLLTSSFYQSLPLGPKDQPDYVNAVVQLQTSLDPDGLLDVLQAIENQLGRERIKSRRWGPRSIDLDILLYSNVCIQTDRLQIPHYDMKHRSFVLYPLLEIMPHLRLPCGETVQECCAKVPMADLQRLD